MRSSHIALALLEALCVLLMSNTVYGAALDIRAVPACTTGARTVDQEATSPVAAPTSAVTARPSPEEAAAVNNPVVAAALSQTSGMGSSTQAGETGDMGSASDSPTLARAIPVLTDALNSIGHQSKNLTEIVQPSSTDTDETTSTVTTKGGKGSGAGTTVVHATPTGSADDVSGAARGAGLDAIERWKEAKGGAAMFALGIAIMTPVFAGL